MADILKDAFDKIRAEESLKRETSEFLHEKIRDNEADGKTVRKTGKKTAIFKKYAVAAAFVGVLIISGSYAYSAYSTPVSYLDVDVNPSVELTLNGLDRVIGTHAFNEDGQNVIDDISLKHKSYDEALQILMESMDTQGYLQDGGLVTVTLLTDDVKREDELLTGIENGVDNYVLSHHQEAEVDVFSVSGDTRSDSHALGVSPAKYLAIQELIEVDPTASVESCRNHSISEIKQMTKGHGNKSEEGSKGGNSKGHDGSGASGGGERMSDKKGDESHGHGH